jgi:hypothetical protein
MRMGVCWILVLWMVVGCEKSSDDTTTGEVLPEGITVVHIPPFRVLGAPEQVDRSAEEAIRASADQLRGEGFTTDPTPTLDIWLFSGAAATAEHTRRLFGHEPDPPEGFYSVAEHAIVVDVSQADPVHFVAHAFVHANLPGCPVWFDEGMACLFEAPDSAAPPGTQLPTLRELTRLDQAGFHGRGWQTHKTAARLLCRYLRHQGRLEQTLGDLRLNLASDPTGYGTLLHALGHDDEAELQDAWERWLRTLEEG